MSTAEELQTWAEGFRHFAARECVQDPLYLAICQLVADTPELLALMQHAPQQQRRPNLLLAAVHEQILRGVPHPLSDYYPSVGGQRLPDAELAAHLVDFVRRHQAMLVRHLQTRSTQTNETGRCAVLWPALQHIAALTRRQDLALLDFGSSAGLNLGVDSYHYDYGHFTLGAAATPERPLIRCDWHGDAAPPHSSTPWRLAQRLGLDPSPIDVFDADAVRWLHACLWPYDRERAERLERAVALARSARHQVRQMKDCIEAIADWLSGLTAGVQPVLFNSWVLAYLSADDRERYHSLVNQLVLRRGLVWLSAEEPRLRPAGLALPAVAPGVSVQSAILWSLLWRGADEQTQQQALAWSHPHGRWLQWAAPAPH